MLARSRNVTGEKDSNYNYLNSKHQYSCGLKGCAILLKQEGVTRDEFNVERRLDSVSF